MLGLLVFITVQSLPPANSAPPMSTIRGNRVVSAFCSDALRLVRQALLTEEDPGDALVLGVDGDGGRVRTEFENDILYILENPLLQNIQDFVSKWQFPEEDFKKVLRYYGHSLEMQTGSLRALGQLSAEEVRQHRVRFFDQIKQKLGASTSLEPKSEPREERFNTYRILGHFKTPRQIAQLLEVPQAQVWTEMNSRKLKFVSEAAAHKNYYLEYLPLQTVTQMAETLGVSEAQVYTELREFGLSHDRILSEPLGHEGSKWFKEFVNRFNRFGTYSQDINADMTREEVLQYLIEEIGLNQNAEVADALGLSVSVIEQVVSDRGFSKEQRGRASDWKSLVTYQGAKRWRESVLREMSALGASPQEIVAGLNSGRAPSHHISESQVTAKQLQLGIRKPLRIVEQRRASPVPSHLKGEARERWIAERVLRFTDEHGRSPTQIDFSDEAMPVGVLYTDLLSTWGSPPKAWLAIKRLSQKHKSEWNFKNPFRLLNIEFHQDPGTEVRMEQRREAADLILADLRKNKRLIDPDAVDEVVGFGYLKLVGKGNWATGGGYHSYRIFDSESDMALALWRRNRELNLDSSSERTSLTLSDFDIRHPSHEFIEERRLEELDRFIDENLKDSDVLDLSLLRTQYFDSELDALRRLESRVEERTFRGRKKYKLREWIQEAQKHWVEVDTFIVKTLAQHSRPQLDLLPFKLYDTELAAVEGLLNAIKGHQGVPGSTRRVWIAALKKRAQQLRAVDAFYSTVTPGNFAPDSSPLYVSAFDSDKEALELALAQLPKTKRVDGRQKDRLERWLTGLVSAQSGVRVEPVARVQRQIPARENTGPSLTDVQSRAVELVLTRFHTRGRVLNVGDLKFDLRKQAGEDPEAVSYTEIVSAFSYSDAALYQAVQKALVEDRTGRFMTRRKGKFREDLDAIISGLSE